ncbi:CASP-like protein 4C1 [Hibiscus syriacus]|uniref:CASP-like protein n=1 Tax=Hibiscus syriacus TaxID=106335 RepID=A0A6A2X2X6_HIBSY|nr:CASP-like protein 4C1 [Hibiscus syriacus]
MRSPHAFRNNDTPSSHHRNPAPHFHNTATLRKLRRFNSLILVFRVTAFTFSLASSVFMVTNSRGSDSPHWFDFDAFRFVFAANAIVALYSLFEMGVSVWEISTGATLFPEILQVWFDFGHDQVFAYLLLSADLRGNGVGEEVEGYGHVYGVELVLRAIRHIRGVGFRRVFVSRVVVSALGFSGCLFHYQRLSFSSLVFR